MQKWSEGRELNSEEKKKYENTVKEKKDVDHGLNGERPREINSPSVTRGTKWMDLSLQQGNRQLVKTETSVPAYSPKERGAVFCFVR